MDQEIYTLEAAHLDALEPWARALDQRLRSCEPTTAGDRAILAEAARGVYRAAGLAPPARVLFAASPFAAEVGARLAAGVRRLVLPSRTDIPDMRAPDPAEGVEDLDPESLTVHPRARRVLDGILEIAAAGAGPVLGAGTPTRLRHQLRRALEVAVRVVGKALDEETGWDPPPLDAPFELAPPEPPARPARPGRRMLAADLAAEFGSASLAHQVLADTTPARLRHAGVRAARVACETSVQRRTLSFVRDNAALEAALQPSAAALRITCTSRDWGLVAIGHQVSARRDLPQAVRFLVRCAAFAEPYREDRDALCRPLPRWISFFHQVVRLDALVGPGVWRDHEAAETHGRLVAARPEFAVAVDRPLRLGLNPGLRAHSSRGPSLAWRDGYQVHHLNGVRVPAWLADPAPEDIDPRLYTRLRIADVQREFVRKIGMERLCGALGAARLDCRDGYELLAVNLGRNVGMWPYLKMLNPSTGDVHLEAVARSCVTVEQALSFRNGGPFRHLAPLT